jgi:hypothetical protein
MAKSLRSVVPLNLGLRTFKYGAMGADIAKRFASKGRHEHKRRKEIRKEHHHTCDADTTTVLAKR